MLLTLNVASLRKKLRATGRNRMEMLDVPAFAIDQLNLRGLIVDTELLEGWSFDQLDHLRTRADQASCPCLVLRESRRIAARAIAANSEDEHFQRLEIVARAGHRLGCNAIALGFDGASTPAHLDAVAALLRRIMERIDRMELHLLVEPGTDLLADSAAQIELIKKVGGFRIGSLPSFDNALKSDDALASLRQTAPYANAILASCGRPGRTIAAEANDLKRCMEAILSVGYEQNLSLDYQGDADPVAPIERTRALIEEIIDSQ